MTAVEEVVRLLSRFWLSQSRFRHLPIFAYWNSDDHSLLVNFHAEWSAAFPQFRIIGDDDVVPLLERQFPEHVELYKSIRIPSVRSDIARFLLLFESGGLYVDCHCGIRSAYGIRHLLKRLEQTEAILFDRMRSLFPGPPKRHTLISGILFSRARSDLMLAILRKTLANLAEHRAAERKNGLVPYGIWAMAGPGVLSEMVLQANSFTLDVRPEYRERVTTIPEEDAPIARNRHRAYSVKGQHWSERQKVELLFEH